MDIIRKLYKRLSELDIKYIYDNIYYYRTSIEQIDTCPVCLGEVSPETKSIRIPCHSVCVTCADAWLNIKKQCPMCRSTDVDTIEKKYSQSNEIIGYKLTQGLLNMTSCHEKGHNLRIEKPHGIIVVTCRTCIQEGTS